MSSRGKYKKSPDDSGSENKKRRSERLLLKEKEKGILGGSTRSDSDSLSASAKLSTSITTPDTKGTLPLDHSPISNDGSKLNDDEGKTEEGAEGKEDQCMDSEIDTWLTSNLSDLSSESAGDCFGASNTEIDEEDYWGEEEEACASALTNPDLLDDPDTTSASKVDFEVEDGKEKPYDMNDLKKSLSDILTFDTQDKENKGPHEEVPKLKFSEVYSKLNIGVNDVQKEVSSSMAFLGMLHLASENNLRLENVPGDDTNFFISPES